MAIISWWCWLDTMANTGDSPVPISGFQKGPIPSGGVGRAPSGVPPELFSSEVDSGEGKSDESTRRTGDCITTVSGLEIRFGDVTSSASAGSTVAVGLVVWFSDVASPDLFCSTALVVPLSP